jgi:hypothetical protein
VSLLQQLGVELGKVGIRGRLRDRILAEAADHLADGDPAAFGDPVELAALFADEVATHRTRRVALTAFAALAACGIAFGLAWIAIARAGSPDLGAAPWEPLGIASALGTIVFPQFAFACGLLALLRAIRRRREPRLAAAEIDLLLDRTRFALTFGLLSMASLAVYAAEYGVSGWIWPLALGLMAPLSVAAVSMHRAAAVKSSVPGDASDVFDDLPVPLPRKPWLLCAGTAGATALAAVAAAPNHEGIRNGVVEVVLVVAGFLALGRRLGIRR